MGSVVASVVLKAIRRVAPKLTSAVIIDCGREVKTSMRLCHTFIVVCNHYRRKLVVFVYRCPRLCGRALSSSGHVSSGRQTIRCC